MIEEERNRIMDYIITEAAPKEAEEILEYLKIVGSETDNLSFGAEGLLVSAEAEAAYLKSTLDSPVSAMFLAKRNGRIIGNAHFTGFTKERMKHRGTFGISVIKEEWGKGVGSRLLEEILAFAKNEVHAEIISLEVRSNNARAIGLYKKYGFEKIGEFKGFTKVDGQYLDFDLMNLYIEPDTAGQDGVSDTP